MNRPERRRERLPENEGRSLGQRVDREIEKIVRRVMTNEGLEETIDYAIQKALVKLVARYLVLAAVAIVLLLSLHSVLLVALLKSDFPNFGENSALDCQSSFLRYSVVKS